VAATVAGSVAVPHARPRTPGCISGRLRPTRVPALADSGPRESRREPILREPILREPILREPIPA